EVIYNWTDETVFKPVERDPALAAALGLTGRFNIVYAGNLGAFQGLDTVIRAAAMIRGESRIQVVLSGTGQCEAQLKSLARELEADNVRFLGHREYSEMPRINALADVLLVHLRDMPFLRGTIPSKTQVSLASARPILMAVRGDASDIVRDAGAAAHTISSECRSRSARHSPRRCCGAWPEPRARADEPSLAGAERERPSLL